MSPEFQAYKSQVERQRGLILDALAHLGFGVVAQVPLSEAAPDTPLAVLLVATRIVAEQLALLARQRDRASEELREKMRTIALQTEAILELSTPVIQVWDEILVLPLIGTVDTARSQQIMDDVLHAVVKQRATVVIIDITGVAVIDTRVANHLINAVEATRLLGAVAILTGVSPDNAQTLVRLGVDLRRVATRSSLQKGLKHAFDLTGQKVEKV